MNLKLAARLLEWNQSGKGLEMLSLEWDNSMNSKALSQVEPTQQIFTREHVSRVAICLSDISAEATIRIFPLEPMIQGTFCPVHIGAKVTEQILTLEPMIR